MATIHLETLSSARELMVDAGDVKLPGILSVPRGARNIVIFAHGSGSSRLSARNRYVADRMHMRRMGTLLLDLLTADEERAERYTAHLRFNVPLLGQRIAAATHWLARRDEASGCKLGYFGASTGAAAALLAASALPDIVNAVVSRGGRPDLAMEVLGHVHAPTLFIVGGRDQAIISLNMQAYERLAAPKAFQVVEGATHLFEEPGALEQVSALAIDWFDSANRTSPA